eukprot:m.152737 g.152737  ORF g.152737 m.152737 type:complete len:66 (+) comp14272_c0_seq1:1980-2177(+)
MKPTEPAYDESSAPRADTRFYQPTLCVENETSLCLVMPSSLIASYAVDLDQKQQKVFGHQEHLFT